MPTSDTAYNDSEEPGFFRRHRFAIGAVAVVAVAAGVAGVRQLFSGHSAPSRQEEISLVRLLPTPPPPPPPPPPPQQPPPEEKMIDQTPVAEPEPKPEDKPAPPAPSLGTNIKGDGPGDSFGLSGSGDSGLLGGRTNGGDGSRWGWYASQVQTKIAEALHNNNLTRSASISVQARIWSDASGRIMRVQLKDSVDDPAIDDAIKNEILAGLQLEEAPPRGMPMPIVLRLNARRPN